MSTKASDLQLAYLYGELGDFVLGGPALTAEEYSCAPFDTGTFRAALATMMSRHEMLRAAFDADGHLEIQGAELPVPLEVRDLAGLAEADRERVLDRSRHEMRTEGPPLRGAAPFRFRVFDLGQEYRVHLQFRLLCMDGLSGEIFAKELREILDSDGNLPPIGYSFPRYLEEQGGDGTALAAAREYWLARLGSLPPAPNLPAVANPDAVTELHRRTRRLTPPVWDALAKRTRENRLTPTVAVFAAFADVLRYWSRDPSFTVNMLHGDRPPVHQDIGKVLGNFSSTVLVACAKPAQGRTFRDRARALRRQLFADLRHGAYSGVSVIRELNRREGTIDAAVMPVVFTSMLAVAPEESGVFLELLGWKQLDARIRTPQVAFDHQVYEAEGGLVLQWDTADELYPPGVLDDMFDAYVRLLTWLAEDETAWERGTFPLLPPSQARVRAAVNDTAAPVEPDTLHGPFFRQAARTPDAPAVRTGSGVITYGALARRAMAIAGALRRRGTTAGETVGVRVERGGEQIAALLGVLAAGAAYVPISPGWPAARQREVVRKAGIRTVLGPVGEDLGDAKPLPLSEVDSIPLDGPVADDPEALAYVIFTSGTTGSPKGVMIRHRRVANTIADINSRFAVTAADRVLAVSDYTFDLSVYDVFGLLAVGGTVVVPDPGQAREVTHLHRLAASAGVTVWNSVPAYLAMLADFARTANRPPLPKLRLAMVSGDWAPLTIAKDLRELAPSARCVSLGGATEASIWSNCCDVPVDPPPGWVSVPYGFPLRNQRYHVLDGDLCDRPAWVAGDLYIAGDGLADGYLFDEELTARAFRALPSGEPIYRTGDTGRYWPDGTLEFLGRQDLQVKVNGFRVELTEIEARLLEHPAVTDAVVVAHRGPRGVTLVAFAAGDGLADELGDWVRATLPDHAVPRAIELVAALPLTRNGKVDRAALAARAADTVSGVDAPDGPAPESPVELRLARIWEQLLGVVVRAASTSFFALGGNSLDAARLMNRIERDFGVRLPLATLFRASTVRELAGAVEGATAGRPDPSCLLPLAVGSGPPLVLVHPVGGDVLCYRALVDRLSATHSVYGLRLPPGPLPASLAELAGRYAAELANALPDKDFPLVGWSLGGVVGQEVAARLGGGNPVVMIDPWVCAEPDRPVPDRDLVAAFLTNLGDGAVPDLPAADAYPRAADLLRAAIPDGSGVPFDELLDLFQTFSAMTRALLAHRPSDGAPTPYVLEADEGLAGPAGRYLAPLREAGWAVPDARFRSYRGDHFTVVSPEGAAELAEAVRAVLTPG
ncbi:amino acid adenylation domain-containing protein [Amycolatopsis minnesotensis]|uniref:Phenyloxazoline synthase MbtB n=1 Tax=Amycolatopsis minnesotensis TaxID=337894 RepID=A0ABP5C0H2_9PSEU